jgi:Mannosyltransferase (PIG-V)
MPPFGVTSGTDDVAARGRPDPDSTARRWSLPEPRRLPPPAVGAMIYVGIRLLSLIVTVFLLRHGTFRQRGVSLTQWVIGGDGSYYRAIAAHGYQYPPGQPAHAAVLSFFPGYPAAIDSLAWLPGVSIALAGFAVTVLAGMAAAWGLVALGLKLTADPRISLLLAAIWAVAPGSIVLSRVHAEALFCALAVWTLVALLNRRWLTAGALVVLAGTVRSTALALIAAVAVAVLTALIEAARTRQRIALWWRPVAALLLAPLGLIGYWAYVALATHRLDGWLWIEEHVFHMSSDWGVSTARVIRDTFLDAPSAAGVLVTLAFLAALGLTAWSLTERIPVYLHAYTVVVALMALTTSANWMSSKPRFILPAFLLALPLARLLAPLRTSVLVPLLAVLTAASTWFGLYLLIIAKWAS